MRAIWSGEIAFGLVNVPVKVYSATQSHEIAFHQVHDADGGRIRYERKCDVCGEAVEYAHIEKAYEEGGQTVVLTADELESLPSEAKDEIEVVQFVPGQQIDPIRLSTPYFLEPVGKSPKSYVLLRDTLSGSELTAVVRFTLRSKTRLGVLRAKDDVLVLQTLLWDDDIRVADFPSVTKETKVSDKEMQMARALVEQFSGEFHPEEFKDDYQEELRQLIDAKLAEGDAVDTAATFGEKSGGKSEGTVVSLMEALERSLQRRKAAGQAAESSDPASGDPGSATAGSAEDGSEDGAADTAAPAKKAPAKKAPAKKTAAKKPAAKSPAAKAPAKKSA